MSCFHFITIQKGFTKKHYTNTSPIHTLNVSLSSTITMTWRAFDAPASKMATTATVTVYRLEANARVHFLRWSVLSMCCHKMKGIPA